MGLTSIVAVVPIAGRGTRLGPLGRAVAKALLPLPDRSGSAVRPALHDILADAAAGGVHRAVVVHSPSQEPALRSWLEACRSQGQAGDLPDQVDLAVQTTPGGLGQAVLCARAPAGRGPILVLLGDHVPAPDPGQVSCAGQVLQCHRWANAAMTVGVQSVAEEVISSVGVCRGERVGPRVFRLTAVAEKPTPDQARAQLATPGLPRGEYLAHFGSYVFPPEVFEVLEELEASGGEGELGLTEAESELLRRYPGRCQARWIEGRVWDIGTPGAYCRALRARLGKDGGGFSAV
jgi:UTP--glucose-1-phosphate uridylyltransferase